MDRARPFLSSQWRGSYGIRRCNRCCLRPDLQCIHHQHRNRHKRTAVDVGTTSTLMNVCNVIKFMQHLAKDEKKTWKVAGLSRAKKLVGLPWPVFICDDDVVTSAASFVDGTLIRRRILFTERFKESKWLSHFLGRWETITDGEGLDFFFDLYSQVSSSLFFCRFCCCALFFVVVFSISSLYVKNDNAAVIKTAAAAVHLSSDGGMDCVSTLFSL